MSTTDTDNRKTQSEAASRNPMSALMLAVTGAEAEAGVTDTRSDR